MIQEILKEKDYSLYKDEQGDYWIEVVCGSIGLYEVKVKLLPDEVEKFKQDPNYLKDLSFLIAHDPVKYEKR